MAMPTNTTAPIAPMLKKVLIWKITPSIADAIFAWGNVALLVGAILVALGTIVTIKMGSVRDYFSDLRISNNEKDASDANANAAQATNSAEQAKKETEVIKSANLVLQQQVEVERTARLKLEQKLAPRHLSKAENEAIANAMRPFAGFVISVTIPMGDVEAKGYALDFVDALRSAGWNCGDKDGIDQALYGGPPPRGISVDVSTMDVQENKVPSAAGHIIMVLKALGLEVTPIRSPELPSGTVRLVIGSKPE